MAIDDSECDVENKTILDCNSEGVQHNDLCYVKQNEMDANIDGSIVYDLYDEDNDDNIWDYTTAMCGRSYFRTFRCIKGKKCLYRI